MSYFLGLDGGGTKTAIVIIDESGMELGRGHGGPCNIATCDDPMLRTSVSSAISQAMAESGLPASTRFHAARAGVAGYTAKRRRAEFLEILEQCIPADNYRIEPDYMIAYWGATEGEPGIIVSAGTGAVVFGRNEKGEAWREDGNGFLLGDKGSGFYIGRWALYRTLGNLRRGRELEEFDQRLLAAIECEDADDLIEWTYRDFSPARIAALAEHVCTWVDEGVGLAIHHLDGAANALHHHAACVARELGMPFETTPFYLCGSLWQKSNYLKKRFQGEHLRPPTSNPTVKLAFMNIRQPKHDPAYGAAFMALKEAVGDV
jgi:glucosamine kinase